jgi:hypothetical protein
MRFPQGDGAVYISDAPRSGDFRLVTSRLSRGRVDAQDEMVLAENLRVGWVPTVKTVEKHVKRSVQLLADRLCVLSIRGTKGGTDDTDIDLSHGQ